MKREIRVSTVLLFLLYLIGCNAIIETNQDGIGLGGSGGPSVIVKKDVNFLLNGADIEFSLSDVLGDMYPLSQYSVQVQYCPGMVVNVSGNYGCDDGTVFSTLTQNSSSSLISWNGTIINASQAGVLMTLTSSSGQVIKQTAVFSSSRFSPSEFRGYTQTRGVTTMDGISYLYDDQDILWKSPDGESWFKITPSTAVGLLGEDATGFTAGGGKLMMVGYSSISNHDEVWISSDFGKNWNRVAGGLSVLFGDYDVRVVYSGNGKWYVYEDTGGNLWSSSDDGISWSLEVPSGQLVTFNTNGNNSGVIPYGGSFFTVGNQLFLMGGLDNNFGYINDVWSLTLGTNTWSNLQSRDNSPAGIWVERNYPAVSWFKNQFILLGGVGRPNGSWGYPTNFGSRPFSVFPGSTPSSAARGFMGIVGPISVDRSDVWASTDGTSWYRIASNITQNPFNETGLSFTLNDTLFYVGGILSGVKKNDVWKSTDAINWVKVTIPTTRNYTNLVFQ